MICHLNSQSNKNLIINSLIIFPINKDHNNNQLNIKYSHIIYNFNNSNSNTSSPYYNNSSLSNNSSLPLNNNDSKNYSQSVNQISYLQSLVILRNR